MDFCKKYFFHFFEDYFTARNLQLEISEHRMLIVQDAHLGSEESVRSYAIRIVCTTRTYFSEQSHFEQLY